MKLEKQSIRNRTVLFMGSTPNIGTTVVSFGAATRLAKETKANIAYLCLNLKSSKIHRYLGMDEAVNSLDHIRSELKSQSLSSERLKQCCHVMKGVPNLHLLLGNMLREQADFFSPDDIKYLLRVAEATFDLCLVEVNAYWDNAATVCGILHANTKIIVTTNELGNFQEDLFRWVKSVSSAFGINYSEFDLFITQYNKSNTLEGFSMKEIRKETAMNVVGEMKSYHHVRVYLNHGRITELFDDLHPLSADLANLVRTLTTLYGLERAPVLARKPWIKRLWAGAEGGI